MANNEVTIHNYFVFLYHTWNLSRCFNFRKLALFCPETVKKFKILHVYSLQADSNTIECMSYWVKSSSNDVLEAREKPRQKSDFFEEVLKVLSFKLLHNMACLSNFTIVGL